MSSVEVLSAVHGIAPRSDELLKLGIDYEKGRIGHERFELQRDEESIEWSHLQEDYGIDIREDGKLWWQDQLRNIVKGSTGFAQDIDKGPVTRWFEDNRFYRQPTILERLHFDPAAFAGTTPSIGSLGPNISLLAPRSFAALCRNEYDELPPGRNVLHLYSELLFYLEQAGVNRVTFEDYSDGAICSEGKNHALADVEILAEWCPNIQFALINPHNRETAISWKLAGNLGIQISPHVVNVIAQEPVYRRPDFRGGEVWHNVIDASTTAKDTLNPKNVPLENLQAFGVARVVLTHNVDLECLPLTYAQDKVKRLGEFAAQLREEL